MPVTGSRCPPAARARYVETRGADQARSAAEADVLRAVIMHIYIRSDSPALYKNLTGQRSYSRDRPGADNGPLSGGNVQIAENPLIDRRALHALAEAVETLSSLGPNAMYFSVFAWPESAVRVAGRRPSLVTVRDAGTGDCPVRRAATTGSQARRVLAGVNWRCAAWRYGSYGGAPVEGVVSYDSLRTGVPGEVLPCHATEHHSHRSQR